MAKRKSLGDVPNASSDGKCIWSLAMEDALVDAYVHQHNIGNRQGGTFTSKALDEILLEMREKFPNKMIDKTKIKDHMKRLKNKFTPCYDLFKNGLSGFGWDPNTNMWTAEDEVWEKLIEAKPEAAVWRNKPIPYYEKLLTLYGQDRATGEHAETAAEIRQREVTQNRADFETIEDINILISNNEATLHSIGVNNNPEIEHSPGEKSQAASQGSTMSNNKKRKGKEDIGMEVFAKSLDNMVETFVRSSADFAKTQQELLKSQQELVKSQQELFNSQKTRPMTDSEVWNLLAGVQVDRSILAKAYYFLIRDVDAQRALVGCPPEMRKEMLMVLMSSNNIT